MLLNGQVDWHHYQDRVGESPRVGLDVKGTDGEVKNWAVELGPPNASCCAAGGRRPRCRPVSDHGRRVCGKERKSSQTRRHHAVDGTKIRRHRHAGPGTPVLVTLTVLPSAQIDAPDGQDQPPGRMAPEQFRHINSEPVGKHHGRRPGGAHPRPNQERRRPMRAGLSCQ